MDIVIIGFYKSLPPKMKNHIKDLGNRLNITGEKVETLLKIVAHVTANRFVYEYIDNPQVPLRKKQSLIFNEIKNNLSNETFMKINAILHVMISEFNKLVENKDMVRKLLLERRRVVTEQSKFIKERNEHKSDLDCWLEAEMEFMKNDLLSLQSLYCFSNREIISSTV